MTVFFIWNDDEDDDCDAEQEEGNVLKMIGDDLFKVLNGNTGGGSS